ncbi:MAG: hypothetical protein KGL39_03075 [Patescibacteria group bacterium]|nr:hypothetical protein [Patescibacteria group bacterium]
MVTHRYAIEFMTQPDFERELTELVKRAFHTGVKHRELTPEQIADTLIIHGESLRMMILQMQKVIEAQQAASAIVGPDGKPPAIPAGEGATGETGERGD